MYCIYPLEIVKNWIWKATYTFMDHLEKSEWKKNEGLQLIDLLPKLKSS